MKILNMIPILAGSIYIMVRRYLDFKRLYHLHQAGGRYVIQANKNLQNYRKSSALVDSGGSYQCDQIIRLTGPKSKDRYPEALQRCPFDRSRQQAEYCHFDQYHRLQCRSNR